MDADYLGIPARIWAKVKRGDGHDCWLWSGRRNPDGYGTTKVGSHTDGSRRTVLVHKLVLEARLRRPLASGMETRHTCDNRACANPDHLIEGTHAQNIADRDARGRTSRGEGRPGAKLTTDDVRVIRASALSQVKVAAQFGISATVAGQIRRRLKWRHVE